MARLRLGAALPLWWHVARPWLLGPSSRRQAARYVALCTLLAVLHTWMAVKVSFTQRRFSTALSNKDRGGWMAAVWEFVSVIPAFALVTALEAYTEKRLVAVWRTALCQAFLTAYTANRAFFHMQLARGTEGSEAGEAGEAAAAGPGGLGGGDDRPRAHASDGAGGVERPPLKVLQPGGAPAGGKAAAAAAAAAQPAKAAAGPVVAGLSDASASVDNPDQRITNDVFNYVQTSVALCLLLIRKALNCIAFSGVLFSISPRLVVFLLLYALLGTVGTALVFGGALTRLKQRLLRLEADLRFGLVRLRENAEAIAFYGGDEREAAELSRRLAAVLAVLLLRVRWLGAYELWLCIYKYSTIVLPSLILAPQFFSGSIEFGVMTQASFAFSVLQEALRLILEKLDDLSSLAAETARLAGLLAALQAADVDAGGDGSVRGFTVSHKKLRHGWLGSWWRRKRHAQAESGAGEGNEATTNNLELAAQERASLLRSSSGPGAAAGAPSDEAGAGSGPNGSSMRVSRVLRLMDGPGFSVEGLTAAVPGRHHQPMVIADALSFSLQPGESLLVLGPSGCGKSSLLRIIAGLWTVGSGTIRGPATTFFLPQRAYMPLGSLRQQLLFPSTCPEPAPASGADGEHTQELEQEQHAPGPVPPLGGAPRRTAGLTTAVQRTSGAAGSGSHVLNIDGGGGPGSGAPARWSAAAATADSDDTRLRQLLADVRMDHLLSRFPGGLDAAPDWASLLSLGEQQRVAIVRLLLHAPSLAFLDEATAALDPASERNAYALIRERCACYVSVGHRLQLLDWHSHVLVGGGGGVWRKLTAAEYRQRLEAGLEG